ncbi:ETC complex I subunit conserved region-domain-containing protein [Lipomyces arxii]|uniref:ETC complex I subunit conserved region-domain-containing protein n=1 Tax=Lipomyces arxii TaxID=56418 RepID=UPI0034CE591F
MASIRSFGLVSLLAARRSVLQCTRTAVFSRLNSTGVTPTTTEEPSELETLKRFDLISGAPPELANKKLVRIYQRAKSATQSGKHDTKPWRLDWDIDQKENRWENDVMGWGSSGDYMQATEIKFKSQEDAVRFATNQGWDYYIQEPHKRDFKPKQYATNFLHSSGPLKHIRTK